MTNMLIYITHSSTLYYQRVELYYTYLSIPVYTEHLLSLSLMSCLVFVQIFFVSIWIYLITSGLQHLRDSFWYDHSWSDYSRGYPPSDSTYLSSDAFVFTFGSSTIKCIGSVPKALKQNTSF